MRTYSYFFTTLHDEPEPVGPVAEHLSVLRAVTLVKSEPRFHDFAIIWDADHDRRVIEIAERLWAADLLGPVLAIGERKACVTIWTNGLEPRGYALKAEQEVERVPSDHFSCEVRHLTQPPAPDWLSRYLGGVDAVWTLGAKGIEFGLEPRNQGAR